MVTQNKWRTRQSSKFATAVDVNKCLKQIKLPISRAHLFLCYHLMIHASYKGEIRGKGNRNSPPLIGHYVCSSATFKDEQHMYIFFSVHRLSEMMSSLHLKSK